MYSNCRRQHSRFAVQSPFGGLGLTAALSGNEETMISPTRCLAIADANGRQTSTFMESSNELALGKLASFASSQPSPSPPPSPLWAALRSWTSLSRSLSVSHVGSQ